LLLHNYNTKITQSGLWHQVILQIIHVGKMDFMISKCLFANHNPIMCADYGANDKE